METTCHFDITAPFPPGSPFRVTQSSQSNEDAHVNMELPNMSKCFEASMYQ